jgi:hypothetical protein
VALSDDVHRIAEKAAAHAAPGEDVAAVLAVELASGERLYLCAFTGADGGRSWLALDHDGAVVTSRKRVRDAASIAALVEVAEESVDVPPAQEPRVASLAYLDSLGAQPADGNLAGAIQGAVPVVDELAKDIESNYRLDLT